MRTIQIGIIGTGLIGKVHLENYAKIDGVKVVAVCDINQQEAHRVAQKYDVPHVYADYRDLLKRNDIEAVDVCLHNNFHGPVTIAAFQAGKHVYCEKPIAGTYFDGKAMLEAAAQHGRKLHIQLGTLYRPETKAAKALIDGGKLGKLFHVKSNGFRRRGRPYVDGYGTKFFTRKEFAGGGALLDMGVYHIAQILYLLGIPEVERISGKLYQEMEMDTSRKEESRFDVEELAFGFVKLAGGITLGINEAWSIHLGGFEGSSIVGNLGGIRLPTYSDLDQKSPFSFHTTMCDMDFNSTLDLAAMDERWHRLRENEDAYDSSQHHWIAALQGRVALLPTAELALKTMLISEGIYLSDELGREVSAEEVIKHSKSTSNQEVK